MLKFNKNDLLLASKDKLDIIIYIIKNILE